MGTFCVFFRIPPPQPSVTNYLGVILLGGIFLVSSWLYFALSESSQKRASLGKRFLGIIVTDLQGNKITFFRATIRFWGKFFVFPGFSLTGLIAKKKALHDIMAGTLVLNKLALSKKLSCQT
jgi:uncharacterized RDD family membrane protein YckC